MYLDMPACVQVHKRTVHAHTVRANLPKVEALRVPLRLSCHYGLPCSSVFKLVNPQLKVCEAILLVRRDDLLCRSFRA